MRNVFEVNAKRLTFDYQLNENGYESKKPDSRI